jgi:hypothetical protein
MTRKPIVKKHLKGLLAEYRLDRPVPRVVRNHFSGRMSPIFKGVLKKTGAHGIVIGIFASLYFFFRRLGITLTAAKIAVTVASLLSLLAGGYFLYYYLSSSDEARKPDMPMVERSVTSEPKRAGAPSFTIAIDRFTSTTIDDATLDGTARSLSQALDAIRGPHFTRYHASPGDEVRYLLMGNIEKVDGTFILFVKVIDSGTSAILYAAKERAASQNELDAACERLSRDIASRIR